VMFGPHECARCSRIIYSAGCPYCKPTAATAAPAEPTEPLSA
jgi:RNA polymerase subunit RPABC4/transcription elongation factor Spt4